MFILRLHASRQNDESRRKNKEGDKSVYRKGCVCERKENGSKNNA